MEPVELTAAAIATLFLTKALEKTGEKLGEEAFKQGGKLLQLLKRKSPETASAIEKVVQNPELAEQQPQDYGVAVLIEKVEETAKAEPEVAAALRDWANVVQSQGSTIQNFTKLAEKIGMVVQGGQVNIDTFNVS
jgi:flagellar biosynthesis/type III secretory pathway M-ring protein FliF/YscJ